jgi:acyl-homoserine lactone synthase
VIHLITAENRHLYERVLAEMHQARTEYFVKGRGWAGLSVENGRECDDYDDEGAIYLIGFEDDGSIAVSARLLSAEHGCVLSDVFPHLVSDGPVRGPGIYELSRYFASRKRRGPAGFAMRSSLHVATLEAAIERGARRLVGFTDLHIMTLLRYTGWRVKPIGLPAAYDEGTAVAFEIGCKAEDLASARRTLQLGGRQLFQAPSWLPRGSDVYAIAEATGLLLNAPSPVRQPVLRAVRKAAATWAPQGDLEPLIARLGERAAA